MNASLPIVEPLEPSPAPIAPPTGAAPIVLYYWNVVRRRIWLIAGVVVAALIAGLLLTLLATPQYTAKSRIEISRLQPNVTNVETVQREEPGQQQEFYSTQYSFWMRARSPRGSRAGCGWRRTKTSSRHTASASRATSANRQF